MTYDPTEAPAPRPDDADADSVATTGRLLAVLRAVGLVLVALFMVWLVFNVKLPELGELQDRIDGYGWWSWLVFVGAYAVVAMTPIPVTVMALTGGVLFGIPVGSALSLVGAMLGGFGGYWLARALGKDVVLRLLGSRRELVEQRLTKASFHAVFALRSLPGMPYWPVNYGAGAFGVPFQQFVVAAGIATIPGQIALVSIGAFAASPSVLKGVVVGVAWAVTISFTIWAWRSLKGTSTRRLPGSPRES